MYHAIAANDKSEPKKICTKPTGEIEVVFTTGGQGSKPIPYQLIMNGSNFRAPQNMRVFSGLGSCIMSTYYGSMGL